MLPVTTPAHLGQLDRDCEARTGLPSLILMETAGTAVAREAQRLADGGPVLVVCGAGNNGGDGWVAARRLHGWGVPVHLWALRSPDDLRGDAAVMARAAVGSGIRWTLSDTPPPATMAPAVIVDAVFGTGLSTPPEGPLGNAVAWLAAQRTPVLAVDIPSGLCGTTGKPLAPEVPRAVATLTFGALKAGLLNGEGPAVTGRLVLVDIGYPLPLMETLPAVAQVPGFADIAALLPQRSPTGHKRTTGQVLVIGGSTRFPGAPVLSAEAALRTGAGMVTLAVPESIFAATCAKVREVMPLSVPTTNAGTFAQEAAAPLLNAAAHADAVVLGPGLGEDPATDALVMTLLAKLPCPIVLDADGLNALSRQSPEAAAPKRKDVIYTPHHGEWARLSQTLTGETMGNDLEKLRAFTHTHPGTWLIKQPRTLVAADGALTFNPTGTPALSTAGSGDVLSGLLGALLARGLTGPDAARAGVFLHGLTATLAEEERLGEGAVAGDFSRLIPKAGVFLEEQTSGMAPGIAEVQG